MRNVAIPESMYDDLVRLAARQKLSVDAYVTKVLAFKVDHQLRTIEGITAANKQGKKSGIKPHLTPEQLNEAKLMRWDGQTFVEIQKRFPMISRNRLAWLINHG